MGNETRDNMEWVVKTLYEATGKAIKLLVTDNGSSFLSLKKETTVYPHVDCAVHASWNAFTSKSDLAMQVGVAWCKASTPKVSLSTTLSITILSII